MLLQMGFLLRNKLISKTQVVKMDNPLEEYCHKLHCFNNSYLKKKKKERQIHISLFQWLILAPFNIKIKIFAGSIAHEVIRHE